MTTLNNHRHSMVYILYIAALLKGEATVGSGKLTEVNNVHWCFNVLLLFVSWTSSQPSDCVGVTKIHFSALS